MIDHLQRDSTAILSMMMLGWNWCYDDNDVNAEELKLTLMWNWCQCWGGTDADAEVTLMLMLRWHWCWCWSVTDTDAEVTLMLMLRWYWCWGRVNASSLSSASSSTSHQPTSTQASPSANIRTHYSSSTPHISRLKLKSFTDLQQKHAGRRTHQQDSEGSQRQPSLFFRQQTSTLYPFLFGGGAPKADIFCFLKRAKLLVMAMGITRVRVMINVMVMVFKCQGVPTLWLQMAVIHVQLHAGQLNETKTYTSVFTVMGWSIGHIIQCHG